MKKYYLSILMLIFAVTVTAQPAMNGHRRMQQLKKLKMIEELNLDDATAEKFFIAYNTAEDEIRKSHHEFMLAAEELNAAVDKGVDKDALKQKIDAFQTKQKNMFYAQEAKQKEIRAVLNDAQFAQFLVFEIRFNQKVKDLMIKGRRQFKGQGQGQ